eukprot:scaffold1223_cov151-Amphora_coffeaeformis.AAC.3
MVKANSHHGLDRKYKPWRRGKSQNAKAKKGSLKQQLRGLNRLLPKAQDDEHKAKIQQQIQELEAQIDGKQVVEQQKQNARKSHGVRFLERQRLTRLWQTAAKLTDADKRQEEQYRIGLDMLYVAHYPLEVRYQPLFRKNQRILLDGRNLARRAAARSKLFKSVATLPRMPWVPASVYEKVPESWSNVLERQTFGVVAPGSAAPAVPDDRFANATADHESILQAAQAMDAALDAEEEQEETKKEPKETKVASDGDSSSSEEAESDDDDDESDGADPLEQQQVNRKRPAGDAIESEPSKQQSTLKNESLDDSSSSDDSSSDDDDDDSSSSSSSEENTTKEIAKQLVSTSDTNPGKKGGNKDKNPDKDDDNDDEDDFLVTPEEAPETSDVFANAKETVPSVDEARGDKSQGWATQRQRPGQFKKRRTRR